MKWSRRIRDLPAPPPGGLASEAEVFLAGGAAGLANLTEGPVPAWAWLNGIAHCPVRSVFERAVDRRGHGSAGTWEWALRALSEQLVRAADHDEAEVLRLQRAAMVPLELALLADERARDISPEALVSLGSAVIRVRRRRPRVG